MQSGTCRTHLRRLNQGRALSGSCEHIRNQRVCHLRNSIPRFQPQSTSFHQHVRTNNPIDTSRLMRKEYKITTKHPRLLKSYDRCYHKLRDPGMPPSTWTISQIEGEMKGNLIRSLRHQESAGHCLTSTFQRLSEPLYHALCEKKNNEQYGEKNDQRRIPKRFSRIL